MAMGDVLPEAGRAFGVQRSSANVTFVPPAVLCTALAQEGVWLGLLPTAHSSPRHALGEVC